MLVALNRSAPLGVGNLSTTSIKNEYAQGADQIISRSTISRHLVKKKQPHFDNQAINSAAQCTVKTKMSTTKQEAGGMSTADGARKRTPGGVFFTLLKQHMEPARLKALYADEIRVKKEKERKRRAANKRKAGAADAGDDVTLATPRDSQRVREQRSRYGNGPGGRTVGEWTGPTYDCDVKRVRAAAGP